MASIRDLNGVPGESIRTVAEVPIENVREMWGVSAPSGEPEGETFQIDDSDAFNEYISDIYAYDGSTGTNHMGWSSYGDPAVTGLMGTLGAPYSGGWTAGKGGYCRFDKELNDATSGYLQFTPTTTNTHMLMGLCYKTDFTGASLDTLTDVHDVRDCHRWGYYNWGSQAIAAGDWVSSTPVVFTPGSSGAGPQNAADRTIRLSWADSTVKLQYSDDGGESLSDVWTFALGIDIESNGNLYLCFSTYYASAGAFQDIEINGSFE
tara:strand:+ start:597 stop:1385 length:789 start_codon:yes stop_codon:yes gene_type:complete